MRSKRVVAFATIFTGIIVIFALAGCAGPPSGPPFQENAEPGTAVRAVQDWIKAMMRNDDFIVGDEWEKGEDGESEDRFWTLFKNVSDPSIFEGATEEELERSKEFWRSDQWKVQVYNLQFEVVEEKDDSAVVEIVGGEIQYVGEIFGTSEAKVDNFKDKPAEIVLKKIDNKWRIAGGRVAGDSDYWEIKID